MKKSAHVSLGLMATVAASLLGGCGDHSTPQRADYPANRPAASTGLPAEAMPPGTLAGRDARTSGTQSTYGTTAHHNNTHRTGYIPVPIGSSFSGRNGLTPLSSTPGRTYTTPRPSTPSVAPSRPSTVTRGGFGTTARSSSRISVSS